MKKFWDISLKLSKKRRFEICKDQIEHVPLMYVHLIKLLYHNDLAKYPLENNTLTGSPINDIVLFHKIQFLLDIQYSDMHLRVNATCIRNKPVLICSFFPFDNENNPIYIRNDFWQYLTMHVKLVKLILLKIWFPKD